MPDDDQFENLMFPINGIDRSMEFELQPERTTPLGMNVRGFESETQRQRGGSRAGLIEYIPEQLGDVSAKVQHMNTVTFITDAGSLLTGNDTAAGGSDAYMADPSSNNFGPGGGYGIVVGPITISGGVVTAGIAPPPVIQGNALSPPASLLIPPPPYPPVSLGIRNPNFPPGRSIRIGGSGVQPNRNVFTPPPPSPPGPPPPGYVQANYGGSGGGVTGSYPITGLSFNGNVFVGDLLVVAFLLSDFTNGDNADADVSFTDSLGTSYSQIGSYLQITDSVFLSTFVLGVWAGFATASGANSYSGTINVSGVTGGMNWKFGLVEYKGPTALTASSSNIGSGSSPSPGSVTAGSFHQVIAVFGGDLVSANLQPGGTNRLSPGPIMGEISSVTGAIVPFLDESASPSNGYGAIGFGC